MGRRKSISKKTRFEVFKRDSFTCQYCGRSAPDVVLELEHINPVCNDGEENILNYLTSCFDCNRGKGKRKLDDKTELEKQKRQLKELNERRLQMEMMVQWKTELLGIHDQEVEHANDYWCELTNCSLTENGKNNIRKIIKKYGLKEVLEVMEISANQYLEYEEGGKVNFPSAGKAFNYISNICRVRKTEKEKPYMKNLYYIRGILRNRLNYCNEYKAIALLEQAYLNDYSIETLKEIALEVDTWLEFENIMEELTGVS